jgi:hypothetical protein
MQPEPSTSTLLTMEQQFALRKYQEEIGRVPRDSLKNSLLRFFDKSTLN